VPRRIERRIDLTSFKRDADRLLPADHPFRLILRKIPDLMDPAELHYRIQDWIELL
jgi:hypothetical protein